MLVLKHKRVLIVGLSLLTEQTASGKSRGMIGALLPVLITSPGKASIHIFDTIK